VPDPQLLILPAPLSVWAATLKQHGVAKADANIGHLFDVPSIYQKKIMALLQAMANRPVIR
jgi:hypothetical protein